jgi:hypothetical protein
MDVVLEHRFRRTLQIAGPKDDLLVLRGVVNGNPLTRGVVRRDQCPTISRASTSSLASDVGRLWTLEG